jgi:hypothetical protein
MGKRLIPGIRQSPRMPRAMTMMNGRIPRTTSSILMGDRRMVENKFIPFGKAIILKHT